MTRQSLFIGIAIIFLSGCSSLSESRYIPEPSIQADNQRISNLVAELDSEHMAGTFDGSVFIAQGDKILLKQSYGYADRTAAIQNSAVTISDMGSIAKTFTAVAILKLIEENQLQLDTSLGMLYPQVTGDVKDITVLQLLSHNSGMDNFHNDSDFEQMDKEEAVRRIFAMPLIHEPGSALAYSNAAYTLLAAIVEDVSGQSFQNYVRNEILMPLALNDTGFYLDSTISTDSLASGYGGDDEGQTTFEKGLTWALVGAGGMVTSLNDLVTWTKGLQSGVLFPGESTNPAFTIANERWLLGSLVQRELLNVPMVYMGGSTDYGYTAMIHFVPSSDYLIVLLLNGQNDKYETSTHHRLMRNHILPILLD